MHHIWIYINNYPHHSKTERVWHKQNKMDIYLFKKKNCMHEIISSLILDHF